jgi:hypothetical protein
LCEGTSEITIFGDTDILKVTVTAYEKRIAKLEREKIRLADRASRIVPLMMLHRENGAAIAPFRTRKPLAA